MLKIPVLLSVFLSWFASASTVSSTVVATVNGDPIYESELSHDSKIESRDDKIKKAIQYRLIIQEAKKRGLERTPEVQAELNKLIYKRFIEDQRKTKKKQFSPTEKELHAFYLQYPLIRIRHLTLNRRNETETHVASLALEQINKALEKGMPFDQLCVQFSQESSGLFGGDTDFRGPHNFPEALYLKIKALPKNLVSEPIEIGHSTLLFQWFEKKPFTAAPASYLQFLQGKWEQEKEAALLAELVKDLELKATIEPRSLSVKAP